VVDMGDDASITSVVKVQCSSGAHHWLIRKPDGPISEGVCKWCNAHRDFTNEVSRRYTSQNRLSQGSSPGQAS
jgi:hypothetical protein